MLGYVYAFLCFIFFSFYVLASKHSLKKINEYLLGFFLQSMFIITIPLVIIFGIPSIGPHFVLALIIGSILNFIATIFYLKAIKNAEVSSTIPFITLTPLFLLITSPFIVGEYAGLYDMIGIVLIVIGTYVLEIKKNKKGFLSPFKELVKNKSAIYMLIVAFIYSITSNIDKIGVQNSSPLFWVFSLNLIMALLFACVLLKKSNFNLNYFKKDLKNIKFAIPAGIFKILTCIFQMLALNLIYVSHVIAIKRSSVILTVLLGAILFKEKNLKQRIFATLIIVAGVLIMILT